VIFYFSGTGNSYAAAKQIAESIEGETAICLAGFNDFDSCGSAERIGIAFPCYIGKAPDIVLEFKKKLAQAIAESKPYVFCVITFAHHPAIAHLDFNDVDAWFEVRMPENDIANSRAPSVEKERKLLAEAKIKIDGFAKDISDKKPNELPSSRAAFGLLLKVASKSVNKA
jgi:hypothetical protein